MKSKKVMAVLAAAAFTAVTACGQAEVTFKGVPEGSYTGVPHKPFRDPSNNTVRGFATIKITGDAANVTYFHLYVALQRQDTPDGPYLPILEGNAVWATDTPVTSEETVQVWAPCVVSANYRTWVKIVVAGTDYHRRRSSAPSLSRKISC